MSLSLAENIIVVGADNRPPMLDKTNYSSWASRMLLYIKDKERGKLLVDLVLNGPFQYRTMVETGNETTPITIRARTYTDLTDKEKIRESIDIKETNIVLQETIHLYYMRFAQLINDMHTIVMTMKPLQVNTKFVNHLQQWIKFVTDVKLAKDMHTTNFDHLYTHLRQHEAHANEVRLERQMYPDQIALVANSPSCFNPTQYYLQLSSVSQQYYPSHVPKCSYDAPIVQQSHYRPQVVTPSLLVHQQQYQAPAIQQSSAIELDSGLFIPWFNHSDDPIANLNKLMEFLSTTFDGRVNVQTLQGRQTQGYVNNGARKTATNPRVNRQGDPIQAKEIPTPAAFQTDDLDAFDSNYDDVPSAKAILMANLSSYDSDVLSKVLFHDTNIEKDKKYFEIKKKELSLDNDRLLDHFICQDVMNVVMHDDVHNVLSVNTNYLDNDHLALASLKMENDHLMELLISQDLVYTAVNSLAAINDYKSMQQNFLDE
ncbi:hypothetical protein Tco_0576898 [Tanacetum coccineum]